MQPGRCLKDCWNYKPKELQEEISLAEEGPICVFPCILTIYYYNSYPFRLPNNPEVPINTKALKI